MKSFAWTVIGTIGGTVLAADQIAPGTTLPLKEVILYSSGVGYFERAGQVDGAATVNLRFRTEDINDLLKSMVVQDPSGTIGVVSYDSRDPISRTLQSFAIDLTANPNMRDILNQMRGERVRVLWPQQTSGTVLGVETRVVEEEKDKKRQESFLNLFTGGNLQSIPLNQVREIQLENPQLQKELEEALATLAKTHDNEKKTVTLTFSGDGKRDVNVSYITEAPVWKTTYRLVLGDNEGFIQGWAVIENTTDDNWENVQLSLVSGRPISFKMDLYQPLYAPRPTVQPELYLSLQPQLHSDSLQNVELKRELAVSAVNGAVVAAQAMPSQRFAMGRGLLAQDKSPENLGFDGASGLLAAAEGSVTGELFQYVLKIPVSIQRQKSAMLPIVTEKIEGAKLSIYNQNVQVKHPLNGIRLKNTTDLHLMQGPITVFDGGSYAGDARIEDLAPGQDRLISYALDLKTEVESRSKSEPETLVSARIRRGTFQATKKNLEEKTYTIRNKDQKKKTIVVEHPVRADWKLESPSEPSERARDVYRFKLEVEPGKTQTLVVREARYLREELAILSLNSETYGYYLRAGQVSPRVKEVLRKVGAFQDELAQLAADRKLREDRLQEIGQEQNRIRENMQRLSQNAELYQRYVKKFDEQETEFERLRKEATRLKEQEAAKQRELHEYLSGLDLD